jgi:hypothetical protein
MDADFNNEMISSAALHASPGALKPVQLKATGKRRFLLKDLFWA